jgi:hypothetical protein
MSATALLDRLDRVKQTGPGRWLAKCPSHQDSSPSLSVRELDDGRVLINCFGGCGAIDVLQAAGLEWGALFPPNTKLTAELPQSHSRVPARDLLEIISEETSVIAIIAADFLQRKAIGEVDWQRLATAASRIHRARDHVHGR